MLLSSVKALEKSLAGVRVDNERLGSENLALIKRGNAAEEKLSRVSDQLGAVGTQLALVAKEKNG